MQWYKVYKDPEGSQILEQTDSNNTRKISVVSIDDGYYKCRITELNEEIMDLNKKNKVLNNENKVLNDELAMVGDHQ